MTRVNNDIKKKKKKRRIKFGFRLFFRSAFTTKREETISTHTGNNSSIPMWQPLTEVAMGAVRNVSKHTHTASTDHNLSVPAKKIC